MKSKLKIGFTGLGLFLLAISVSVAGSGNNIALAQVHEHIEVLNEGHADIFGVVLEDDGSGPELELVIFEEHEEGEGGEHEHEGELHPEDAVIGIKVPESQVTIPANPDFAFLGTAGDTVYVLPQTENPLLLWPGLGAEELTPGDWTGPLSLVLDSVSGPGDFFLYTVDGFGVPTVLWDSTDLVPNTVSFSAGDHVHFNYAFTALGTYSAGVQVSGTHATEGLLTSAVAPYTFHVGDIAEVEAEISVDDPTPQVGTNVTFTVGAHNEGPDSASGVEVLVTLPAGLTYVSDNSGGSYVSGTGVWTVGSLASESEAELEIVASVDAGTETTTLTTEATVSNTGGELDPGDENTADVSVVPWLDEDPGSGDASQDIEAEIVDGGLSISVAADTVDLGVLSLNGDNTLLEATGALNQVEVLDLRLSDPGWSVNGQVGTFSATTGSFSGSALGWTPSVEFTSPDQTVNAGSEVDPDPGNPGSGLSGSSTLGSAPAASGRGTAVLGAELDLEVPTSTSPGDYTATLTLTVI